MFVVRAKAIFKKKNFPSSSIGANTDMEIPIQDVAPEDPPHGDPVGNDEMALQDAPVENPGNDDPAINDQAPLDSTMAEQ